MTQPTVSQHWRTRVSQAGQGPIPPIWALLWDGSGGYQVVPSAHCSATTRATRSPRANPTRLSSLKGKDVTKIYFTEVWRGRSIWAFGTEKLDWFGYPKVWYNYSFLTECTNVTDGRTDTTWRHRDTAVPAEGNGNLQTLICVLVARPNGIPFSELSLVGLALGDLVALVVTEQCALGTDSHLIRLTVTLNGRGSHTLPTSLHHCNCTQKVSFFGPQCSQSLRN